MGKSTSSRSLVWIPRACVVTLGWTLVDLPEAHRPNVLAYTVVKRPCLKQYGKVRTDTFSQTIYF